MSLIAEVKRLRRRLANRPPGVLCPLCYHPDGSPIIRHSRSEPPAFYDDERPDCERCQPVPTQVLVEVIVEPAADTAV